MTGCFPWERDLLFGNAVTWYVAEVEDELGRAGSRGGAVGSIIIMARQLMQLPVEDGRAQARHGRPRE